MAGFGDSVKPVSQDVVNPQLYSRVGFMHAFRPLSAQEVRQLLHHKWLPSGVVLPEAGWSDEEVLAAIIRITGGNFRLLHRLASITASATCGHAA